MHYAGARYYMSEIGRWNGTDPLADDLRPPKVFTPAWSPQAYSYNNPIGFSDPTGMAPMDEFRVDRTTGDIEKISNKGGDEVDTYHIGQYVRGGTNFTVARTVDIERADSGIQINAFRIEQGTDYQRTDEDGNPEGYTLSTFHAPGDAEVRGIAVEPGGAATTTANLDKRIPAGDYDIDPNADGTYPIGLSNEQVPESRKIKMHAGNFGIDTAGCWMPTPSLGNKQGGKGSGDLMRKTIKPKIQNAGGGTLTIVDDPNMRWRPTP
jgi:RHS repeat-associated protein